MCYAPIRRREGILLCTCWSIYLSVCLSVCRSFCLKPFRFRSITNVVKGESHRGKMCPNRFRSITRESLIYLLHIHPHINPGEQMNPNDFGVTWLKVKVTRVKFAKPFSGSIPREHIDRPSSNSVHTSILVR